MTIEFFIPLQCAPKQSFRAANGHGYQPKAVTNNAAALAEFCAKHRPAEPIDAPVSVNYVFQRAYLKKDAKARANGLTVPDDTRPDLDNLEKQLQDVFERVGIITNDARIWNKESRKVRTLQCGVQVMITTDPL